MLCLIWAGPVLGQASPHIITFFIRPLPNRLQNASEEINQKIAEQVNTPGRMLKSVVKKKLSPVLLYSGIYAAYAGTLTHSNANGQVLFERFTPEAKIRVLITEDMKAVPVNPLNNKTLYGFTVDPKAESAQYLFERVQDPETELYSWNVSVEPVNKKKRIAYDTIIIFAEPKNIIAPVGPTATTLNENFVLPDFYATPNNKTAANAFRFLKVRHYFAPVKFEFKFQPDGYQQKIVSS